MNPPTITMVAGNQAMGGGASADNAAAAVPDPATLAQMAKADPIRLLDLCIQHFNANYHDYTCSAMKQERVRGTLGTVQSVEAKVRDEPYSVALRWLENPQGADRALFVAGQYNDKLLVRPIGLAGVFVRCVRLDPTGPQAMNTGLYPITEFGFKRELEIIRRVESRAAPDPASEGREAMVEETHRPAILIVRHLAPDPEFPASLARIYLDPEYLVATKIEGFDASGQLVLRYVFSDISFNVGLTDDDFTPKANDLPCPD